jgi:hypothetical protein
MRIRNVAFLAAITSGLAASSSFAYEDEGFQWWTGVSVTSTLTKDVKWTFEQSLRLGDDGGNLFYESSDLGFSCSGLADWLDLGAGFRLVYEKDSTDHFKPENRPYMSATFKGRMGWLLLSDKNLLEFRDRYHRDDGWRYRNKITVRPDVELTALKLKPYVAEELFITLTDDVVDKNRLYFGAVFPLNKNLDADIYYAWQAAKSGHAWQNVDILGTSLRFHF